MSFKEVTPPVYGRKYTLRYYNYINNVGGQICRCVLRNEVRNTEKLKRNRTKERRISDFLTAYKGDIEEYQVAKAQFDKLFPDGRAATSADNFDITLIIFLLQTFIFRHRVFSSQQLNEIDQTDTSKIADLARIRCYRNMAMHDFTNTDTSLSEKDFWKFSGELTQIFLRLGDVYQIAGIFKRINRELNDPLDEERENELDKKIQLLREDMEQSKDMEKKITEFFQTQTDMKDKLDDISEKLTLKVPKQQEVRDILADEYFVETTQYKEARQALKDHKIIVLNGAPGEGKTTMAKKLVKKVSTEACIKVSSRADWENITFDKLNVDAVLIDDMFGAGNFDKEECRKWQKIMPSIAKWVNEYPETPRYVVITSRTYILQEAMKKMFLEKLFTEKNVYALLSQNLLEHEKLSILENHFKYAKKKIKENQNHFSSKNKKHNDDIRQISKLNLQELDQAFTIGFPECARLFASNEHLYNEGIEFFKTPKTHISECVSEICRKDDVYIAFFVLWAQVGRTIRSRDLENPVQETSPDIKDPILKLQYHPHEYLRKIREELYNHVHHAGLITLDPEELFRFSHDVVRDAVGLISFKRNPTATLSLCDKDFIKTYIHFPSTSLSQKSQSQNPLKLDIELRKSRYDQLSWRIAKLAIPDPLTSERLTTSDCPVSDENKETFLKHHTIFNSDIFKNEDFCTAFVAANRTKNNYLETLLKIPLRRIDSMFLQFQFVCLEQVNTEVRLPSYLLWHNEKVTFLAELLFSEMEKYPALLQKELFTAMLVASAIGSYTMSECLIRKGAQINSQMILIAYDNLEKQRMAIDQTNPPLYMDDQERIVDILQTNASLPDSDGYFPIHLAALKGHLDLVRAIFHKDRSQADKHFSSTEKSNLQNASLYHIAAFKQNKDLVELLLSECLPAIAVDKEERTPLLYAIYYGKSRIAQKLLHVAKKNGDEMRPDSTGNTPLHLAIERSVKQKEDTSKNVFKKIALELCKESNENIHFKNCKGQSPLSVAVDLSATEVVLELLKRMPKEPDFCWEEQTLLHDLVTKDKINEIDLLLSNGFDHNMTDMQNRTPLQLAEVLGKTAIAHLLRQENEDLEDATTSSTSDYRIECQESNQNQIKLSDLKPDDVTPDSSTTDI